MAKTYKSLLANAKPVYSKDTQLAQLMYQVRDNKNLPSDAPKSVKPVLASKQAEPQNTESYFTKILKQAKQNVSDTRKDLLSGNAFNKERLQERAKGYTSFQEDMIKNTTAGKVGFGVMRGALPYNTDKVEEKIYSADTRRILDESKATKAGEIGGLVTQFTAPYMAGSKVIGKALTKVPQVAKMGKLGQTATRSVATDLAVGLPLNVNYAYNKENLRGSEAAKSIAINTGIDLVAGGVIEAIGGIVLKSGKKVTTKAEFDALPAPEKEEVIKMLPAPAQETKLLSEGVNWTEGKAPTRQLPEPRVFVDPQGGASFSPLRESAIQTENLLTNKKTYRLEGETVDAKSLNDPITGGRTTVFDDDDLLELNTVLLLSRKSGKDAKEIISTIYKNIENQINDAAEDALSYFKSYKPRGTELIPDKYGSEFNKIRVSNNDDWYSKLYKKLGTTPSGKALEEEGRRIILDDIERSRGIFVDPALSNYYKMFRRLNEKTNLFDSGLKSVTKNADGTYNFTYGDIVKVVKPDYSAAKGKKEMPYVATADELSNFSPKLINRKSAQIGVPRKAPSRDITAAMVKNTKPAKSTAQGSKATVQPRSVTKGVKRKDLGADTLKQSDTATNLKRKGALPKGEIPARDVDIPANTPYGDTQRFARTLAEAKIVDDTLLKDIQDAVSKGDFAKFTKSNKTVVDDANKIIADEGFDGAYNMFKSVLKADKQAKSSDIALGARLLQDAQKAGDYEKALDISIDLSQMLSETGRTLQAATIAKRLSPEGRLLLVQRTAKKVSDKYGVKVEVSDDIVEKISEAKTEKEIVEANAEAAKEIWDQVPATWMDKVNAWRYMSMLTNPKTHLRNIFGNALFVPAREFKNIIGAGLEKKFVKEGERTKAILNPKTDADLIKFARSDFKNVKAILKSQGKLDDTVRNLDSKIFGNKVKVLEKARKLNMNALDAEDTWFMKFAYDGSLAQYMKANKLKPADMVGETLDKARKYAMNEAWRATYRDINAFSNLVSKGKHYLAHNTSGTTAQVAGRRIGGMAIEAVLPFAKTPVNILRRGVIDYSPIGIVNGMIKMSKDVKAGKVTAAEAIDNIASGLSGTGIIALGVFLGYRGIVTGEESDWRTKEGKYTDIQGTQNYALNLEDGSYTLDWAAPLSLPFFVGVEIAKGFRDEGFELSKILDSMTAISDPLFNMTMLQGMNQIISTNMEGASDAIFKTATGYASQYVPTVLGQVARTVDGTRRDTRSTAETNLERQVEKFVKKQIAKIPGVSMVFPEYVDLWGRTQDSGGAIQQFLNPGYYKDKNITPVDKEINRLVKNLGNDAKDAIPSDSSYTIKRDGRQYRMSEKELAQFKKTRGQAAYNNIQALIKTVNYQRMTDEDKVKAIRKIHNEALKKAQAEYLRKASPK